MPSLNLLPTVVREFLIPGRVPRQLEPEMLMDDPDQVAAYTQAGREFGVMAPVYLFHTANMCEVVKPGDTVVDLACGPANQLAQVARLNPGTNFIGVDLSSEMLASARALVAASGLKNVRFEQADITDLRFLKDQSIDAVVSSMALHHLPTLQHLESTFKEVFRALRSTGSVYLADFARLRHEASMLRFANQYADRQPPVFTQDYLNSLRAAFEVREFAQAKRMLPTGTSLHKTAGLAFMIACKGQVRRPLETTLLAELRAIWARLPTTYKNDYADLTLFFSMGGLRLTARLDRI